MFASSTCLRDIDTELSVGEDKSLVDAVHCATVLRMVQTPGILIQNPGSSITLVQMAVIMNREILDLKVRSEIDAISLTVWLSDRSITHDRMDAAKSHSALTPRHLLYINN